MDYISSEPEFCQFLTEVEKITSNTKTNYISWLRFLPQSHILDDKISKYIISKIIEIKNIAKNEHNFYSKSKDISNFKSALNKYLKYIQADFKTSFYIAIKNQIDDIKNDDEMSITE